MNTVTWKLTALNWTDFSLLIDTGHGVGTLESILSKVLKYDSRSIAMVNFMSIVLKMD